MLDVLTVHNLQITSKGRAEIHHSLFGERGEAQRNKNQMWNSSRQGVILQHNMLLNN